MPENHPTKTNPEDYWSLWIKIKRKERIVSAFWIAVVIITLLALVFK